MPVPRNAKNIQTWNIAGSVLKNAGTALKNAGKWRPEMKPLSVLLILLFSAKYYAQHEHHMPMPNDSASLHVNSMQMSHAFSRNLPMNRNGSGTGWLPDASVMYGYSAHVGKWMFMFHNNIFLRYNKQDITDKGTRGGEKADAPAWFMLMGQRPVHKRGLFRFNIMLSPDPFTVGNEGYPLLFQSGETYKGKRLVDRQHPHDLFSELSVAYTHMISKDMDVTAYLGYPGEPALGPVAFMHRVSALNNPDAPLSHHWQDATHIIFGVATFGIRYKIFKIEASSFTGSEPDENRYNFDEPKFDSYSFRLLCNPAKQLALQVSQAYLVSPEIADPKQNVKRTTASVIHHLPFTKENHYLSSAAIWGHNKSDHEENSFLLESTLQLDKTAIYGRYEWVEKSADELDLGFFNNGHEAVFDVQAITLGLNRIFLRKAGFNFAIGAQGSLFAADERLTSLYGEYPMSGEVYIRLYPHLMRM
jgi:hypothetical protein